MSKSQLPLIVGEPQRTSCRGNDEGGHALCEDPPPTIRIGAEEFADVDV
jgi:hypothetical protein